MAMNALCFYQDTERFYAERALGVSACVANTETIHASLETLCESREWSYLNVIPTLQDE